MVKEGIRGRICQVILRYAKANNKYMNNYDKKIITYLMYLDTNNLYGRRMSQKLSLNGFKWVEDLSQFNEDLIKNYDENSDKGYFLKVDIDYRKKLFNRHKDFPFLPKREKTNKCEKLVCNLKDKEKYVVGISALKQALNHGLKLKRMNKVIQFNQRAWMKAFSDMNTKLRKEVKNDDFEKDFFKLMNNSVFGKTMENVRNYRDIKLLTTDKRRNKLDSEPNYHTSKKFQNI